MILNFLWLDRIMFHDLCFVTHSWSLVYLVQVRNQSFLRDSLLILLLGGANYSRCKIADVALTCRSLLLEQRLHQTACSEGRVTILLVNTRQASWLRV